METQNTKELRAKKNLFNTKMAGFQKEVELKRLAKRERDRGRRHEIRIEAAFEIRRMKAEKAALELKQQNEEIHNVEMLANHAAAGESILRG